VDTQTERLSSSRSGTAESRGEDLSASTHMEAHTEVANKMYSVHGKTPLTATTLTATNSLQASGLDNVLYF